MNPKLISHLAAINIAFSVPALAAEACLQQAVGVVATPPSKNAQALSKKLLLPNEPARVVYSPTHAESPGLLHQVPVKDPFADYESFTFQLREKRTGFALRNMEELGLSEVVAAKKRTAEIPEIGLKASVEKGHIEIEDKHGKLALTVTKHDEGAVLFGQFTSKDDNFPSQILGILPPKPANVPEDLDRYYGHLTGSTIGEKPLELFAKGAKALNLKPDSGARADALLEAISNMEESFVAVSYIDFFTINKLNKVPKKVLDYFQKSGKAELRLGDDDLMVTIVDSVKPEKGRTISGIGKMLSIHNAQGIDFLVPLEAKTDKGFFPLIVLPDNNGDKTFLLNINIKNPGLSELFGEWDGEFLRFPFDFAQINDELRQLNKDL